jgi:hypothetical protein
MGYDSLLTQWRLVMQSPAAAASGLASYRDIFLNGLRRRLIYLGMDRWVQRVRAFVHFGPWRFLPRFIIRQLRPNTTTDAISRSLLGNVDAAALAVEVREKSIATAGVLPDVCLGRLRALTDRLAVDHYELMHEVDADIRRLSEDPAVLAVARAYFGCDPVLLESTLVVTGAHSELGLNDQNFFHFDYAGWQSLNVFVYLTDVMERSSCHVVIEGSHNHIGLKDICRGLISDDEAQRRFGSRIHPITGPAGTVFFENTEAFHRRYPADERRVLLNLLFASHRGMFSYGRSNAKNLAKRKKIYAQLQR